MNTCNLSLPRRPLAGEQKLAGDHRTHDNAHSEEGTEFDPPLLSLPAIEYTGMERQEFGFPPGEAVELRFVEAVGGGIPLFALLLLCVWVGEGGMRISMGEEIHKSGGWCGGGLGIHRESRDGRGSSNSTGFVPCTLFGELRLAIVWNPPKKSRKGACLISP